MLGQAQYTGALLAMRQQRKQAEAKRRIVMLRFDQMKLAALVKFAEMQGKTVIEARKLDGHWMLVVEAETNIPKCAPREVE